MHWLGFADWKAVNSNDTSNSNLQGKREHVAAVNVDGNTVLEITANPPQCGFDSNQSWKKKKMCSQGEEKPVNLKPWEWTIRQNGGGGLCVYQTVEQGLKHSLSKRKQWGSLTLNPESDNSDSMYKLCTNWPGGSRVDQWDLSLGLNLSTFGIRLLSFKLLSGCCDSCLHRRLESPHFRTTSFSLNEIKQKYKMPPGGLHPSPGLMRI